MIQMNNLQKFIIGAFLGITIINTYSLLFMFIRESEAKFYKYIPPNRVLSEQEYIDIKPKLETQAKEGSLDASFALATMYTFGLGVEKNKEMASFWLTCRDNKDDCIPGLGEYYLGMAFLSGPIFYGVKHPADYEQAYWWVKKSAALGFQDAQEWIEFYRELGYIDADGNFLGIERAPTHNNL